MMEKYGRWLDITVPQGVFITAHVNGRDYGVHVVAANESAADFVVDTDERLIILPINAPLFSLVQALGEAKQHEPVIQTQPAAAAPAPQRCRCWSRRGGEIVVIILPGVGKREIPMEHAAGHPELRDIFNKCRDAETEAWKWKDGKAPAGGVRGVERR
jgi:hypothetical protein